jgi:hypothetical protein
MTFMHTHLAYRAKYGCDMSDMITDVEMQLGPVLDQHFWVTLPVHSSVIFLTMITMCVYLLVASGCHLMPKNFQTVVKKIL